MNLIDTLEIVRVTDVGQRRDHNEDAVASDAEMGLVILADGMGGYNAGEVASEIAVLTLVAELKESMTAAMQFRQHHASLSRGAAAITGPDTVDHFS